MENEKINSKKSLLKQAEKIEQEEKERILKSEVSESEKDSRIHEKGLRRNRKHEKRQRPPRKTVFGSILTKIIIILVLIILFLGAGYIALNRMSRVKIESKSALVREEILYCQEFTTLKYNYSDVTCVKEDIKIGKSYVIVKYTGVIRVGISDLSACEITILEDGKAVSVILPEMEILGNDISDMEVFDEYRNIFVKITTERILNDLMEAKEKTKNDLIDRGIYEDARNYAVKIITQMLYSLGFDSVIVK